MIAYMSKTVVAAHVERDAERGLYIAVAPGMRGAHTQAESLDEPKSNLEEVLALGVEERWLTTEPAPRVSLSSG